MVRQTDRMTNRCVLTMRCPHCHAQPGLADANLMVHWLKEMWPPSSTDCNPSDYFMWCEVEREVTKCPHITLASIKVMTSVSSKCIHPNYYFYCFECVPRVCPNLQSAPCGFGQCFHPSGYPHVACQAHSLLCYSEPKAVQHEQEISNAGR